MRLGLTDTIRAEYANGMPLEVIAKEYGVSSVQVDKIVAREWQG